MVGSTVYDALELSFNSVDKTSILKTNNVGILRCITNKSSANDGYDNNEVDLIVSSLIGPAPAVLDTIVELAAALGNDSSYATHIQSQVNNRSDNLNNYLKVDVNVFISMLQSGISSWVLINSVDISGKFNINATSSDISKIQQVDGSLFYDALYWSFNTVDKHN